MKKLLFVLAPVLVLTIIICPMFAEAATGIHQVSLEVVGSSTAAPNGSSTISFKTVAFNTVCPGSSFYTYDPTCSDGSQPTKVYTGIEGEKTYITVSGSGNTLGSTSADAHGTYVVVDANGTATFSLASSVAESKTITVLASPGSAYKASASVAFANAAPATPKPATPAPATPKPATTATPAPAPESSPPAVPAPSSYEIAGKAVADATKITLQAAESLTLGGKTVANGIVKLYIFSTPRESTVTADAQGNWSFKIRGLDPGSHHVEATVTDPLTQKTSERQTIANFAVAVASPVAATAKAKKSSNLTLVILGGAVLLLVLGVTAAWWYHSRARKNTTHNPTPPPDSLDPTL